MRTSESTVELLQALHAANLSNPTKDARAQIPTKSGGSFSYEYADLPTILTTVRPVLLAQGVLVLQEAGELEGRTAITTRLAHAPSGQWLEAGPLLVPHAGDPQAVGSAITYGRRYQLLAVLGLAADDDDGRSAQDTWEQATAKPSATSGRGAHEGASATTPADTPAAAVTPTVPGKDGGEPPAAGATFDDLRKLVGSAAAAREQINRSNGTDYNARTVVDATPAEVALAIAEWMESHQ